MGEKIPDFTEKIGSGIRRYGGRGLLAGAATCAFAVAYSHEAHADAPDTSPPVVRELKSGVYNTVSLTEGTTINAPSIIQLYDPQTQRYTSRQLGKNEIITNTMSGFLMVDQNATLKLGEGTMQPYTVTTAGWNLVGDPSGRYPAMVTGVSSLYIYIDGKYYHQDETIIPPGQDAFINVAEGQPATIIPLESLQQQPPVRCDTSSPFSTGVTDSNPACIVWPPGPGTISAGPPVIPLIN